CPSSNAPPLPPTPGPTAFPLGIAARSCFPAAPPPQCATARSWISASQTPEGFPRALAAAQSDPPTPSPHPAFPLLTPPTKSACTSAASNSRSGCTPPEFAHPSPG